MDFTVVIVALFAFMAVSAIADAIESRGCDSEYRDLDKRVARLEELAIGSINKRDYQSGIPGVDTNTLLSQEEINEIVRRFKANLEINNVGDKP